MQLVLTQVSNEETCSASLCSKRIALLGDIVILKMASPNTLWIMLLSTSCQVAKGECHGTTLVTGQIWFRHWLGAARKQDLSQC